MSPHTHVFGVMLYQFSYQAPGKKVASGEDAYLMYNGHKNLALVYTYLSLHHLARGKRLGALKSVGMTNLGTCM